MTNASEHKKNTVVGYNTESFHLLLFCVNVQLLFARTVMSSETINLLQFMYNDNIFFGRQ